MGGKRLLVETYLLFALNFLFFMLLQRFFNVLNSAFRWFMCLASTLTMNLKTEYLWLVEVDFWGNNYGVRVVLKEYVREARTEIRAININAPELWQVYFLAAGAIHLEARSLQDVT